VTCPGCGKAMEVNDKNYTEFRHAGTKKKNC
jgi:hypothetical protein